MMDWLASVSAAGWIPGVFLSGYALAARLGVMPAADRWVLAPAIGLLLWTVPMLVSGALGFFHPWIFGLAGWIVAAFVAGRSGWRNDLRNLELSGTGGLVLLLALGYGVLSLVTTGETFLGGRDQGGYANHALHIARTGSVWIPFPFESFGERRFGPLHFLQNLSNLGFMPNRMEAQFPPVYAIWMAQAAGVFGRAGVTGFNPVVAALTLPVFYRLGRLFLGRPAALVAVFVFLLNPAQLWMPRITLSEIAAQHLAAAAVFCLTGGWLVRRLPVVAAGGLLLGMVFWTRIDGLVFAPAIVAALAAVFVWGRGPEEAIPSDHRIMLLAGSMILATFAAGAASHLFFTEQYFLAIGPLLLPIVVLTVLLLPLAFLFRLARLRHGTARLLGHPATAAGAVGMLVLVVLWAWWIRPGLEPFDLISDERGRSFRENSLVDLAAYLSEPAGLLILIGLAAAFWRLLRGRLEPAWILPLAAWAGFTALYLVDPRISPDHPWAFRRFVPVTIVGCALLAGLGFKVLTSRLTNRRGHLYAALATCLLLALVLLPRSSTFLLFKENRGADAFLRDVAARIRPGALVFADTSTLFFDPLFPGLGTRVVRVNLGDERMPALIRTVIEENVPAGETVYYLTQEDRGLLIDAEKQERLYFAYDFIAPTTTPPPTEIARHEHHLTLYESKSAPHDPALGYGTITVGTSPVAGIEEDGFHGKESNQWGPFRWTNGHARLQIPLREGFWPRSLVCDIRDVPPLGEDVVLRVNGTEVYREPLATAPGRIELDLPSDLEARTLDLEILSATFVPSEIPGRGQDERPLGICLHGITLSDRPASKGVFEVGTASRPGVTEGGFHGAEVNEGGPFRWTDGHAWVEIPLPAGYVVRQVALSILDLRPDGTGVELQLNGESVFQESYSSPPGEIIVAVEDFPPARAGDILRLDLKSGTFRPADRQPDGDQRVLGLRIHKMLVTDRAPDAG